MFKWGKHCQGIVNVWNHLYVTSQTHPPLPRHQQSLQKILENSLLTPKESPDNLHALGDMMFGKFGY